jgi:hypothetical protein
MHRQPGIADFITRHRVQNDYPAEKTIRNFVYRIKTILAGVKGPLHAPDTNMLDTA